MVGRVPLPTPQEFHARALAHADPQRRLPRPDQSMWEIFPFEPDSLTVKPLDPLTLPEPPRTGEGGRDCWRCDRPDEGVAWANERWTLVPSEESRPAGMLQLRGSCLTIWDEMLPEVPEAERAAAVAVAVAALAA